MAKRSAKATSPLWKRVVAFLALFVLLSGLVGPRIISGSLLSDGGFWIYGSLGKATVFGVIAFGLLVWHRAPALKLQPWRLTSGTWLAAALLTYAAAWAAVTRLLAGERTTSYLVVAHAGLVGTVGLLAIGCLGWQNLQQLYGAYRRQLGQALGIAAAFYVFLTAVYALWQPLAGIVLYGTQMLLGASGIESQIVPPFTLLFDKFGVTIAQTCSGIESIALFSGLYAVVGLLDWQRLNKRRYLLMFPLALTLLFGLNIVRVYLLILAGYFINPAIAFSLFHTYAGMVFFILYSVAFWLLAYGYLITKSPKEDQK